MVLLGRQRRPLEVDELRAEKADALGAVGAGQVDLLGKLDVGHGDEGDPVQGPGVQPGRLLEVLAVLFVLLLLAQELPRTTWGGLTMTSPSVPSTMMKSPFFT